MGQAVPSDKCHMPITSRVSLNGHGVCVWACYYASDCFCVCMSVDVRIWCVCYQATLAVTLRDLLEMYGIGAASAMIAEKAQDPALRNLRNLPEFRQVPLQLLPVYHVSWSCMIAALEWSLAVVTCDA